MSDLGASVDNYDLSARYERERGQVYLTGVQALVRVPIDQMRADHSRGLKTSGFISGYPGSPLGGYDQELIAQRTLLAAHDIVHQPGLNEELAATSVMGSQVAWRYGRLRSDGVVGYWYGKAPGLDRAADAIRHAGYYSTARTGGAVAFVGDDPASKSSTIPSGSQQLMADLNLATFYPGNVQEVVDFGLHAIAVSRVSSLWSGMKIVSAVADGAGTVEVDPRRLEPILPDVMFDNAPFTGRSTNAGLGAETFRTEREVFEVRMEVARRYAAANGINAVTHDAPDAWLGILAPGHTYYETIEALRSLGLGPAELRRFGVRVLRIGMLHPFDDATVRSFARGLQEIFVIEDKRPFLEVWTRNALYGTAGAPLVVGKVDQHGESLVPAHGALDAEALVAPLFARITHRVDPSLLLAPKQAARTPAALQLVARTPYFCSGCPHNTSLQTPAGSKVAAGIGCHSMVTFLDRDRAGGLTTVTQMGGEGAQWIGAAPFVDTTHIFQNLGDGTFAHSGHLAVRSAVAAGSNITYKILYNKAVAMTGGQDIAGQMSVSDMVRVLLAEGVARIIVTTEDLRRYRRVSLPNSVEVWDRDRIVEAQQRLSEVAGVTVLIHDQQCAAEARRLRKRGALVEPTMRVVINDRVCEGCGDCGVKSNCLSVQPIDTEFGDKTSIDQSSCNKDYTCVKGDCPSFVTLQPARGIRRLRASRSHRARHGVPTFADDLPTPELIVPSDNFRARLPGIGGTGVVTVAQILGTAAQLDGRCVIGLDQTGLAQKGGAVVSDVCITSEIETSNKVPPGDVDLYLVFDLVGALAPTTLVAASAERTVAVASTAKTATGLMIGKPGLHQPPEAMLRAALDGVTRADRNLYLDPVRIATGLFGRATSANLLLLGAAYQRGTLPVTATSIERAIELNGVAVETNVWAFRWGRLWVVEPARVEAALVAPSAQTGDALLLTRVLDGFEPVAESARLLAIRVPELVRYQNEAYARRYVDVVRRVHAAEPAGDDGARPITEAVARNLFKLMAYKDEYEVARLHLDAVARARVLAVADGQPVTASFNLHPPFLRWLGMKNKLRLGPVFVPMFRLLAGMRRLRGTPLDPFGPTRVRRTERALVDEYCAVVDCIVAELPHANRPGLGELAALPDLIRGYEDIKLASVDRYRTEVQRLLATLQVDSSPIMKEYR